MSSPLGETLRRARLSKNVTFEDAERVTRIRREYLEALEKEDFGRLPAPVYARGFLRSYAGYLGLDPGQLMPFFPVGHVEEPTLDPLPEVSEPRTWNMSGLLAVGVVGFLILLVVALYSLGNEDTSPGFQTGQRTQSENTGTRTSSRVPTRPTVRRIPAGRPRLCPPRPRRPEPRRCRHHGRGNRRRLRYRLGLRRRLPGRSGRRPRPRPRRSRRRRRRRHPPRQPVTRTALDIRDSQST